ncbi:hypothetical protein [Microbulbifer pacificus]|uniref:hypothetical protein n=1 Tax=Microbulbifer pacificus TaxID=407164 RepID=UPI001319CB0A|nr:hypothetical protein [Microbulbifer pacificus]
MWFFDLDRKSFLGVGVKFKVNFKALLSFALAASIAGNIFAVVHHRQTLAESQKSQEQLVALQAKVTQLAEREGHPTQFTSSMSREEYLKHRAAQQQQQNAIARLAGQKQTAEARMAQPSREAVQSRQQGSPLAVQ